eukprot:PhM_4_TR9544/c1_g2_i1/m.5175
MHMNSSTTYRIPESLHPVMLDWVRRRLLAVVSSRQYGSCGTVCSVCANDPVLLLRALLFVSECRGDGLLLFHEVREVSIPGTTHQTAISCFCGVDVKDLDACITDFYMEDNMKL